MPALKQFTKFDSCKPLFCLLIALFFFVTGCAGRLKTISYVHPTYDFSQVKKVAVLPFSNDSKEPAAGENIKRMVIVELLSMGYVDIVEPGQTIRALSELNLLGSPFYSKEDIRKLGQNLGVPVVLLGALSVYERSIVSNVSIPEINISMWAVETESGTVIWSVTSLSKGIGVSGQLFGFSSETMSEATMNTVRKAVQTLFK